MITAIRTTFKDRLNTKDWLDEETKEKCREKVHICSKGSRTRGLGGQI